MDGVWSPRASSRNNDMTCIIVTHEIAFSCEVADQTYLVIELPYRW